MSPVIRVTLGAAWGMSVKCRNISQKLGSEHSETGMEGLVSLMFVLQFS